MAYCSIPGSPVLHYLLEFAAGTPAGDRAGLWLLWFLWETHVHRVRGAMLLLSLQKCS